MLLWISWHITNSLCNPCMLASYHRSRKKKLLPSSDSRVSFLSWLSLHLMSQFEIQDWAPGILHITDLWYSHVIFSDLPAQNLHSSLTEPSLPLKQVNTFSPLRLSHYYLPKLSPSSSFPAKLVLFFSRLNHSYLVKSRDPKPFSPLSIPWRQCSFGKWSSGRCMYNHLGSMSCLSSLFSCPYKQGS